KTLRPRPRTGQRDEDRGGPHARSQQSGSLGYRHPGRAGSGVRAGPLRLALLFEPCRFFANLGLGSAFPLQPVGVFRLQLVDLLGREWLGAATPCEPPVGTSQPRGDNGTRVRPVPTQLPQPLGRLGLQRVQLVARDQPFLELGRGGFEIHAQFLGRGGGLHGLGGLARRHTPSIAGLHVGTSQARSPGPVAASRTAQSLRLAYVPGVTPDKWVRICNGRSQTPLVLTRVDAAEAEDAVRTREVDAALLRLPIDRTGLHAIPLYTETTVVITPKDHVVAAADTITAAELADEV